MLNSGHACTSAPTFFYYILEYHDLNMHYWASYTGFELVKADPKKRKHNVANAYAGVIQWGSTFVTEIWL